MKTTVPDLSEPDHVFWPVGATSWCKFQRANALGETLPAHHHTTSGIARTSPLLGHSMGTLRVYSTSPWTVRVQSLMVVVKCEALIYFTRKP